MGTAHTPALTLAALLDTMEQQTLNASHHSAEDRPDWQPLQDALRRLAGETSPCDEDPPIVQAGQAFELACLDYVLAQKQEPHRLEDARQHLATAKQKVVEKASTLPPKRS